MIYNKEAGCVYDTIFCSMLEFSKENYDKYCEITYGSSDPVGYYEIIKKELPAPPQQLYPFLFLNGKEWCFLTQYYWKEFNNFEDSFSDFKNKIKEDKNIKNTLYLYYLKDIYNKDTLPINIPADIFDELFNLKLDTALIQQLIKLYYNFDTIIIELAEYLQCVYDKISDFHNVSYQFIEDTIKKYSSEKMLAAVSSYCNLSEDIDISQQTISISLINISLIIGRRNTENGKYIFILGLDIEESINNDIYYKNINPEWIGTITSQPIKREILEHLQKDNYSATQLAEIMYVSRQTVNFHLLELKANMCINIAERRGAEILYKINTNFFKVAQSIMNKYLNEFAK